MNGMLLATGVLLFAGGLHRTECMVYHLALLSRHGNHLELQEKVGEIHYQSDASEPQMINEVGCVWQSANSVGNIKKMYLPKDGCLPLLPEGVGVHATGLKLESNDNFTLHVYQSDDKGALADGYLAIPDDHLGSEYYVNTYCSTGGYCQFAVTGTVDSTSVNVVFPRNIPPGSITCNGTIISTGEPISFILNENDVLHIESTESKVDLSGTYITSNNNVAVFVGARDVPGKDGMPAFMIEQIPPVNKWGTEHVVAPNYLNDAGDIVKIITKDVDTTIHILRFSPFTISNAGETIERRVDWELYSTVKATKPILVIQVISLDIYNYTSIVHGNPAMVLVPHVEQWTDRSLWTDCLQKTPHKSVLTMTAKKDELSSIPWSPSQDSQYTHSTDINASDYSVLVVRTGASESSERQSMGSKFRALYGYCDGASAVLYDVNWEWENEKCVLSVPVPGDGIDNDCDGKIDEDTCTKDDLAVSFISTQDPGTFKTTYKTIYVKKASPVHFSVKSCGIAKIILQTKAEPIITTSIQITSSSVVIQTCSPACIVQTVLPISVSDCNTKQNYEIHWYRPTSLVGTEHVFKKSTGEMYTFIIDTKTIDYDVMLLTSFTSPAEFVVDLPDKDCSKVISGDKADNHGTTFLAPFLGHNNYNIYLTNPFSEIAKVRFLKASDKTILLDNVIVPSVQTLMKTSADLSNEKVVIIESDNEISVYAIMTTTSSKKIGFSILPVDILGPNYHVYLDSSYEADSTPDSATLCRGFSFHDNTVSNIGPVSNMIDITKGIYNSGNSGLFKRYRISQGSKQFDLSGLPLCDLLHLDRYLINGLHLRLVLHRNSSEFCLLSDDDNDQRGYRVKIEDAFLRLTKVKVNPAILVAHSKLLKTVTAKYPYIRTDTKCANIASGQSVYSWDHINPSILPKFVIVTFVDSASVLGSLKLNPFNMEHFDLRQISLFVNGVVFPGNPINVNYPDGLTTEVFERLYGFSKSLPIYTNMGGISGKDRGISGITKSDLQTGRAIYVFDLAPVIEEGFHFELLNSGTLSLHVRFGSALTKNVACIFYAEYDALMEIDEARSVRII